MIHNQVTVVFLPSGANPDAAVTAANQHVYIELTAGTMSAARTTAAGLLVSGAGAGTPVRLDDARDYSVVVLPAAAAAPSPASAGRVRVSGSGRLTVRPHLAIHVTGSGATGLACTLAIGAANRAVAVPRSGWVISNDHSAGAVTLSSNTRLLAPNAAAVPAVTLALLPTAVTRGSSARIDARAPAGTVNLRITEWRYTLRHTNPNGQPQTATIIRPANEAAPTFHQFWQGDICASGQVRALFVTGATVRAGGFGPVQAELVAMEPRPVTLDVAVAARNWTSPVTERPEADWSQAIGSFTDTGYHDWQPTSGQATPVTITSGPNRGSRYIGTTTGMGFVSQPGVNSDIRNVSSTFQSAQGAVRVLAPASVRGQIVPPSFYTVAASGAVTVTDGPGLAAYLGLSNASQLRVTTTGMNPQALLQSVRTHEYAGPVSHRQNCLRAARSLDPMRYAEMLVEAPGNPALNFATLVRSRVEEVTRAGETHQEVDEAATTRDGVLRFVPGSQIPDIDTDAGGIRRTVWNPVTQSALH